MAVLEEIQLSSGVTRLGRMLGIKSVGRNLRSEDAAVEQDIADHRRELGMSEASVNPGPHKLADGDAPVDIGEIMAARDVHIHPPQQAVQPSPPAPTVQPQPAAGLPMWAKALLTAGAIGTAGGGGSLLTYFLNNKPTPPSAASDWELGLIPADKGDANSISQEKK